jgi:diguanylate cyclase (GGDEF)-like protein
VIVTMQNVFESWVLHAKRRPRLLIADDQPINIRVLYELFADECDVFMATSGAEAVRICNAQSPDLILLDVVMDDIDGHEVCRQLKADPSSADIPIIFITSQSQDEDEIVALELGAVDFISKPINPVIVKARVRTHLTLKLQGDLLRASALLDGLTGVANRRKFDDDLMADWRHCLRERAPLSLILLDIDYFKRYNDRYGHQAGDACPKSVARALATSLRRPYDSIARYGGEEFACLLPKTALQGAVGIAEKMQAGIRELAIEHLDSDVAGVVTISLGAATLTPTCALKPENLLEAADKHLYEAKRAGRARVSSTADS